MGEEDDKKELKETETAVAVNETTEEKSEKKKEESIFTKIENNDLTGVSEFLDSKLVNVDDIDEHGMTPLMQASFRGNKDMCQLLLDRGADTMGGNHPHNYTSLHFAGLSGNSATCQLLLQYGAKAHSTNSVGRTAAQMAAFIGNHHCVSIINNFINRKDIEYFTVVQGQEKKPRLEPFLVDPLYSLIMLVNFHPVKIAFNVKKNNLLYENLVQLSKILDLMAEKEIKKEAEGNEIIAFKLHLISKVFLGLEKSLPDTKNNSTMFEEYIKRLLRCKIPGGVPEGLDIQLREIVRAFPFHQSSILHQLVANLNHTKLCEEPGAWGIILGIVNGQKGFRDGEPCSTCGEEKGAKRCSRCHFDTYCNSECQRLHWFVHKKYCKEKGKEIEAKKQEGESEKEKEKASQAKA